MEWTQTGMISSFLSEPNFTPNYLGKLVPHAPGKYLEMAGIPRDFVAATCLMAHLKRLGGVKGQCVPIDCSRRSLSPLVLANRRHKAECEHFER